MFAITVATSLLKVIDSFVSFAICSLLLSIIVFVILKGINTCLCSGMKKNEKLEANIITPTTKAADHDLPISGPEVRDPSYVGRESKLYLAIDVF